jgi:hypothetical protein
MQRLQQQQVRLLLLWMSNGVASSCHRHLLLTL